MGNQPLGSRLDMSISHDLAGVGWVKVDRTGYMRAEEFAEFVNSVPNFKCIYLPPARADSEELPCKLGDIVELRKDDEFFGNVVYEKNGHLRIMRGDKPEYIATLIRSGYSLKVLKPANPMPTDIGFYVASDDLEAVQVPPIFSKTSDGWVDQGYRSVREEATYAHNNRGGLVKLVAEIRRVEPLTLHTGHVFKGQNGLVDVIWEVRSTHTSGMIVASGKVTLPQEALNGLA